jgi:hypothetical protein
MGEDSRREDWRARREEGRDQREPGEREDFGQADFSSDYGYDPDRRAGYRTAEELGRRRDDYGQADYSNDYGYDPDRGRGYRRFSENDRGYGEPPPDYRDERTFRDARDRPQGERRSWADRAGAFISGRDEGVQDRRRGPSDRVLWAVIVERLEDERGLDLRDVEVIVENAEVTLNGTVRRKEEKRRIEDVADLHGVRHVQNNLRVRERRWF